jgi:hypothetical protein
MDIGIANLGWIGILLTPRTIMVKTFAPSSGARVTWYPIMALPAAWGEYSRRADKKDKQ